MSPLSTDLETPFYETIWKVKEPLKVRFFGWLLSSDNAVIPPLNGNM